MPKEKNQKKNLFYIADYLMKETDEENGVYVYDIVEHLNSLGISAESHSVSRDIKVLRDYFKMDICGGRGLPFYLRSREFSIEDLNTIAECIATAKYLTVKQADDLIEKLKKLCSQNQADSLNRDYGVIGRPKSTPKNLLKNIFTLNNAINNNRIIKFHYAKHIIDDSSNVQLYKEEDWNNVIPYQVVLWDGEHYLIGYDRNNIITYQIDRMRDITITYYLNDIDKRAKQRYKSYYTRSPYKMPMTEAKAITILFDDSLLDTVIDKYGRNPTAEYEKADENHFKFTAWIECGPNLYGWLCGLGGEAIIIDPPEAVEGHKKCVETILERYCQKH